MKIGDRVTERITALDLMMSGTVVYIHPEERFYTAEFKGLFGSFRESFFFPLIPINEQKPKSGHHNQRWKILDSGDDGSPSVNSLEGLLW